MPALHSAAAIPFFLLMLAACGDGRPDAESKDTHTLGSVRSETPSDVTVRQNRQWQTGIPLASDTLFSPLEKHSGKNSAEPLAELFMSGSTGHLPERIGATFEGLGLTGNSDNSQLTTLFGQLPAGLEWSAAGQAVSLQLTDSSNREMLHEMQLSYNDIPIHSARIKTIRDQDTDSATYMTGTVPRWLLSERISMPRIAPFALSMDELKTYASRSLNFAEWRFHSPVQIYVADAERSLEAAYLFIVSAENSDQGRGPHVPLEVAVSADTGKILWQRPLAMHAVTGEASLYVENRGASDSPSSVQLPELTDDGKKLSHPLFDVYNCHQRARSAETGDGSVCDQKSHSVSNGIFGAVAYDNEIYDELVSYAATTKAMNWYRTLDFSSLKNSWDETKWQGTRANFGLQPAGSNGGNETRLKIFVRTRTAVPTTNQCGENSTPDNAQYLWSGSTGRGTPEILIGYGGYNAASRSSCYKLRDLGKDMDVIMHEFGHHIVFRGLSNSKNQSVAMHEGFADYFTYAISGNNLLAEYSYPGFKALRQGNIAAGTTFRNFKPKPGGGYYSVSELLTAPHLVGEFWSGILWEIRTGMGREAGSGIYKLDKIVWDAIDLLKQDAGLYEGIIAVSESAKRNALRTGEDPAQAKKIVQDAFVKYGFARYTGSGELAAISELASDPSTSSDQPVTTKTKTKKWGCGDVAYAQSAHSSSTARNRAELLFLLLVLSLPPLASSLTPVARRIAVRVRNRRRRN